MSAIATVPTTDDPSGEEIVVNLPRLRQADLGSSYSKVEMIGVIPYEDEASKDETQSFLSTIRRENYCFSSVAWIRCRGLRILCWKQS